ncbi:hypothetical protein [Vibrio sp. 99-70-13A1]|uniref:hypothetical protein n=1 Tax=Vibrio sp. 99-70-13A1 TaxID=2607601 RepID=UPI0020A26D3E|nr:hypothetical protein [Vibrio sp. 99-70-13A1]
MAKKTFAEPDNHKYQTSIFTLKTKHQRNSAKELDEKSLTDAKEMNNTAAN